MKKLSIVLAVVFALAVAVPVMAAPAINFGGSLETKFTADKDGVMGENWFDLSMGLSAGDKVKATVVLSPWDNPAAPAITPAPGVPAKVGNSYDGVDFTSAGLFSDITVPALKVKKAVLEADGALFNGGPSVHTTLGDMTVSEGTIVGDLGNRRGIEISGLKIGPMGMEAFYAMPGGYSRVLNYDDENKYGQLGVPNTDEVYGTKLDANIAGVNLGATVVKSDANDRAEYALTGQVSPVKNLTVDGYFASDASEDNAYRVNGSLNVLSNLRVFGGYRDTAAGFAPQYGARLDSDESGAVESDEWLADGRVIAADEQGFNAGVETTQAGIHMIGTYDDPTKEAKAAADTTLAGFKLNGSVTYVDQNFDEAEAGVARDFQLGSAKVTGSYALAVDSSENATHEVKAATTLDTIPALKGIGLDARVKYDTTDDSTEYEANAKYTAPNGLNLGVQYIKDADHVDGDFIGTAGMKVQF